MTAFPGERDFSALRAAGCTARTTIRNIEEVALSSPEPGVLAVDVRGNAVLRNMVRIVAGTLVDVGEGRLQVAEVSEILGSMDRTRAGQTAPAHGLELMEVLYDGTRPYQPRPGQLPQV